MTLRGCVPMAISCHIKLRKPLDTVYQAGDVVSGVITYKLTEPMEFNSITTSLKGNGSLRIKVKLYKNRYNHYKYYPASEMYVDIDNVVTDKNNKVPVGSYDRDFTFRLPDKLPASFLYENTIGPYKIKCRVKYYIRIKFERSSPFAHSKHFEKEIYVSSKIKPMPINRSMSYDTTMKLSRLFSRRNSTVSIKALILNSEIPIGGEIQVVYAINNDTNVIITGVSTKLLEVYNFKVQGHSKVTFNEKIPNTGTRTCCVDRDSTNTYYLIIKVPTNRLTMNNSRMVRIDYVVRIEVEMPMPYRNVVLDIPVGIGGISGNISQSTTEQKVVRNVSFKNWEMMDKAKDCKVIDCARETRLTFEMNKNL